MESTDSREDILTNAIELGRTDDVSGLYLYGKKKIATTFPNWEKYYFRELCDLKPSLLILRTLNTHRSSQSLRDSRTDAKHIITPPPWTLVFTDNSFGDPPLTMSDGVGKSPSQEILVVPSVARELLRYSKHALYIESSEDISCIRYSSIGWSAGITGGASLNFKIFSDMHTKVTGSGPWGNEERKLQLIREFQSLLDWLVTRKYPNATNGSTARGPPKNSSRMRTIV
jgi:hypothetical protein